MKIQQPNITSTLLESFRLNNPSKAKENIDGCLLFDVLPSGIGIHSNSTSEKKTDILKSPVNPCLSITVLYEGKINFAVDGERHQFSAKTKSPVLFVNIVAKTSQFERFTIKDQYVRKINVCFDKQWLYQRCRNQNDLENLNELFENGNQVLELEDTCSMYRIAGPLLQHTQTANLFEQIESEQLALLILSKTIELISNQFIKTQQNTNSHHSIDVVSKAIEIGLSRKLTLDEVSAQLKTSNSTLQRKFKQQYGMTYGLKLKGIKLERAKIALKNSELTIGEIAYEADYHHVSNFITAYRKKFNITPAEQRDKYKAKDQI